MNQMTKTKNKTEQSGKTLRSASDREKSAIDDNAVEDALNADDNSGVRSVLPGPPIPPEAQAKLKNEKGHSEKPSSGRR
jgi:hypothetical protein